MKLFKMILGLKPSKSNQINKTKTHSIFNNIEYIKNSVTTKDSNFLSY